MTDNTENKSEVNDNKEVTVAAIVLNLTGNVIWQSGTFVSSAGSLILTYLVSGGFISLVQYGLYLISSETSKSATYSPLLDLNAIIYLKIIIGSIGGLIGGGFLEKVR